MSQYSDMCGEFEYESEEALQETLERAHLSKSQEGVNVSGCVLQLGQPRGAQFRNLGRRMDLITADASSWAYAEVTTDGIFKGFLSGEDHEIDMDDWAARNTDVERPSEDDFSSHQAFTQALTSYHAKVKDRFFSQNPTTL